MVHDGPYCKVQLPPSRSRPFSRWLGGAGHRLTSLESSRSAPASDVVDIAENEVMLDSPSDLNPDARLLCRLLDVLADVVAALRMLVEFRDVLPLEMKCGRPLSGEVVDHWSRYTVGGGRERSNAEKPWNAGREWAM